MENMLTYLENLLSDINITCEWRQTITSTNDVLKQKIKHQTANAPYLLISNQQTAGHGKKNRPFISESGGIYMSLALEIPDLQPNQIGLLTTGIAWQVHCVIEQIFGINVQLKWVNDLLLNNKKIGGILVERATDQIIIVGIGINLFQPEIKQKTPDGDNLLLFEPDNQIICRLVARLGKTILKEANNCLNGEFLSKYKQHLVTLNQNVIAQTGKSLVVGRVIDIDQHGYLVIKTDSGTKILPAGDVIKVRNTH